MLKNRCFKKDCKNKLYGKCECDETILFCKDHLFEHIENPSAKRHQCIRLYFKPAEEIKQPVIEKLTKLKNDIKKYRTEVIINAVETIKNFKTRVEKYITKSLSRKEM